MDNLVDPILLTSNNNEQIDKYNNGFGKDNGLKLVLAEMSHF